MQLEIREPDEAKHRSCGAKSNMYKHYFGLTENPFNVNPDPRYLYLTPQTQEALDELKFGINARKGLMMLTGEVGTGKTTLLNCILDCLHQQKTPTAFIFNSHLEAGHLFDFILADFEVPFDSRSGCNALMRLNQWLIERYRAGDTPVLFVDEAQGLPVRVLEEIRLLLNLETPDAKLLQIVLAGQPELEERLKRHDLRQLKQRVTLRCKTAALTLEQTHEYIQARLHIAGANGRPIFASQAMDAVHFYSRGIQRLANLLCDHALINAYVDQVQPVPVHIIEEIAREFQLDDIKPLVPFMDSNGVLNCNMISPNPVIVYGLAPHPAGAEPLLEKTRGVTVPPVSPRFVVADTLLSRTNEHATAHLYCEGISALTETKALDVRPPVHAPPGPECIGGCKPSVSAAFDSGAAIKISDVLPVERAPISSSPHLPAFKAKVKLHLRSVPSHSKVIGPEKAVHRPTTVEAARSRPGTSNLIRPLGRSFSLTSGSAAWGKRFLSIFNSQRCRHPIPTLLSRPRRPLQSVGALHQSSPTQLNRRKVVIVPTKLRRMMAYLFDLLREPVDPVQLFMLPYTWLFNLRRKLNHKCK
jgi:general secretion pathway protein A